MERPPNATPFHSLAPTSPTTPLLPNSARRSPSPRTADTSRPSGTSTNRWRSCSSICLSARSEWSGGNESKDEWGCVVNNNSISTWVYHYLAMKYIPVPSHVGPKYSSAYRHKWLSWFVRLDRSKSNLANCKGDQGPVIHSVGTVNLISLDRMDSTQFSA